MSVAFVCSGQGGQHPEMFRQLVDEPAAAPVFAALGRQLECSEQGFRTSWWNEGMMRNRPGQLLVVAHSLAVAAVLRTQGVRPMLCAGYSAGEMAAHGAAGVWPDEVVLALTDRRAECMDAAVRDGGEALTMLALIGLDERAVKSLVQRCGAEIALINGVRHVVVGGGVEAIERIEAEAPALGASHVRRLAVDVASHTHFLDPAGPEFARHLDAVDWRAPECTLLSGLDGRAIHVRADSVELLSRQLHQPLNWHQCMESMREYGVRAVVEIGPGRALAKMFAESLPEMEVRAFEEFRSVSGVTQWIARHV